MEVRVATPARSLPSKRLLEYPEYLLIGRSEPESPRRDGQEHAYSRHLPGTSDHVQLRVLPAEDGQGLGRTVPEHCPVADPAPLVRVGDLRRGGLDPRADA